MVMTESRSSRPGKQRKRHYDKPLHELGKDFSVHLSADMRKQLGRRNIELRKGDTVKVMRGNEALQGKQGKVVEVRRKKRQVLIENIMRKKSNGQEVLIPFRPSNLLIVALDDKDARRFSKAKKAGPKKPEEKKK